MNVSYVDDASKAKAAELKKKRDAEEAANEALQNVGQSGIMKESKRHADNPTTTQKKHDKSVGYTFFVWQCIILS